MVEAQVAEELALLWKPADVEFAAGTRGNDTRRLRQLVANPADANIVNNEEVESISEQNRWLLIGSKLADEAAELFELVTPDGSRFDERGKFIGPKPTADELDKLGKILLTDEELSEGQKFNENDYEELIMDLTVRASDMRIRSLQIQLQRTDLAIDENDKINKEIVYRQSQVLAQSTNYYSKFQSKRGKWTEAETKLA